MDRKDKITIERWKLKDIINTFRMLTQTFPKIKERDSCLDGQIKKGHIPWNKGLKLKEIV